VKIIDMNNWPRRRHFSLFNRFDYPHINLSANVDISSFYRVVKERGIPFTVAIIYLLSRAANEAAEFRLRIRGNEVVEHDVVHPSPTVMAADDLFSFCTIPYTPDVEAFAEKAAERMAYFQENPTLEDEDGQDDLLYMTGIPWVSFTAIMHPIHMNPADSVPRIAWGKFLKEGRCKQMPLSVQVHHALMDGLHVGRYFERVQAMLDSFSFASGIKSPLSLTKR
jgi:chloramphenicol O-acetyltransferase type A